MGVPDEVVGVPYAKGVMAVPFSRLRGGAPAFVLFNCAY